MTYMVLELADADRYSLVPYNEELIASDTITPSSGKCIELVWVQVVPDPDASAGNLVMIGFRGASNTIYTVYAVGRTAIFKGLINQPLDIILENTQKTTVNIQYREVDP